MWISDIGPLAEETSETLLRERVSRFLEEKFPEAAKSLFGRSSGLRDLAFSFSPREPAVNRYTAGGEFKIHKDRYALTVNVVGKPRSGRRTFVAR